MSTRRPNFNNADLEQAYYYKRRSFGNGYTIKFQREALLWDSADGGDGNYYVWGGALPKAVPSGSTPANSGGLGNTAWVNIGTAAMANVLYDILSPEMFGAKGDGVTDDTAAVVECWKSAKAKATDLFRIEVVMRHKYLIRAQTLIGSSNVRYSGGGTITTDSTALNYTMITFDDCANFVFTDIKVTRSAFPDPSVMWSKTNQAMVMTNCTDFLVSQCDVSYHTDAISVSSGARYIIEGNRTHELGEEGIAIRRSRKFVCRNNFVFNHHGDGILLKTANVFCHDGLIEGNHVFDGLKKTGIAGGARGGGITLNDEVIGTVSGINFSSLGVVGNLVRNTSYGLSFANVDDLRIEANSCIDIERFGINWDTTVFNNPSLNPMYRGAVVGNNVVNCGQVGISATSLNGINIFNVLVTGNTVESAGTQTGAEYPGISVSGGVVTSNIVNNCTVAYQGVDTVATGNRFVGSTRTTDGVGAVWLKIGGSGVFSDNVVVDSNKGYIRLSSANDLSFNGNDIALQSSFAGLYFTGTFTTGVKAGGNVYSCPNFPSISNFNVGPTVIRSMELTPAEFGRKRHVYDGVAASGLTHLVGDIVSNRAPAVGSPMDYVVSAINGDGTPALTPLNFNRRLVQATQDLVVTNGTFIQIKVTGLVGVLSNWMSEGVATSVPAQGLTITAHVTNAQEVTFLVWNHSGNDRNITGVTLSTYVHSVN